MDGRYPRPPEALASYADTIAERAPATLDQIKEVVLRIDNDRAGLLVRRIKDGLAQILWVDVGQSDCRDGKAFATNWPIKGGILASDSAVNGCRFLKMSGRRGNSHWCSQSLTGPREAIVTELG
jgi:hypothetical protein